MQSTVDLHLAKLFASHKQLSPKAESGLFAAVQRMNPGTKLAPSRDRRPAPLKSPESSSLTKQSFHSPPRALPNGEISPDDSNPDDLFSKQEEDACSSSVDARSDQDNRGQVRRWRPSEIEWDSGESSDLPEEREIMRSPMQERLAQTLDEAISVASEATSVETGLSGRDEMDSVAIDTSDSCADLDSEDGPLSASENALAEKYKPVLTRLHQELDMLVLRYPSVGEGLTTLLRHLAHGLKNAKDSDRLEAELQQPLGQCDQAVCMLIKHKSAASSAKPHLASSRDRRMNDERTQSHEDHGVQSNLPKDHKSKLHMESKCQSWPQTPAPQRQHSNVGPEAEPSPCGGAHADPSGDKVSMDPRCQLLPDAVASAEIQCRTSLQKKLLQIVSQEVSKHFEDLYDKLRIEMTTATCRSDAEACASTPVSSLNGCRLGNVRMPLGRCF
eukprot:gnl/MRDRNA2_/MRDRNA2_33951_c0_seq1.p1 gnl/MRDRNA2_/MRDRNA2_33951_c0~~gnl/MRDRNA2_/MRDRNA2_33951_c0_seq1.p1  ORF type:complete len:444 (-),score=80.81 gnl/MRDRNA2_/MRDRNA2_33951_c0_seq1:321-1652(-)